MRVRRLTTILVAVNALAMLFGSPVSAAEPTAADEHEFVYWNDGDPPLLDSHTFVVQGSPTADGGCLFDDPPLELPAGATAIEQRDIAVDPATCTKLVEEGIPTDVSIEPGSSPISAGSTTYWKQARYEVQWKDGAGAIVSGAWARMKYHYDLSCALTVSGSGTMYAYAPTHWYAIQAPTYSQSRSCSYSTTAIHGGKVGNTWVCGKEVRIIYSYVRIYGYASGSLAGRESSWTENMCVPGFHKVRRLVLEGSGSGGPI